MPVYPMELDVMLLLAQYEGKPLPYQFCVNFILFTWEKHGCCCEETKKNTSERRNPDSVFTKTFKLKSHLLSSFMPKISLI